MQGNKGLTDIEQKYMYLKNKDIEIYSIVSDEDKTKLDLTYSLKKGSYNFEGITQFSLYKEYGSLDNKNDAVFIRNCRLYQLRG